MPCSELEVVLVSPFYEQSEGDIVLPILSKNWLE
ncbi:hypothetical protein SAL_1892 [Streptococcus agalactiae 515]|nr:hypothetical protein SAL_1892 [Streptococcus agalactiae 515]